MVQPICGRCAPHASLRWRTLARWWVWSIKKKNAAMKRKSMIAVLLALITVYVSLGILLTLFQSHLVFFPRRELIGTPSLVGLEFTAEHVTTSDGVRIHGWFIPSDPTRQTVLFCHGNGGNISYLLETIRTLNGLGLNLFVFDYRGYGESGGNPDEAGMYRDAEAAWDLLTETKGIMPGRIIIMGRSLGGAVASWLAGRVESAGLIVESSFTSLPDIAADSYPVFPARFMTRYSFATSSRIRDVHCPVLVIHSQDDEIVPFKHGKNIFASANEPKTFLEISGRHNHGFVEDEVSYREGIDRFVKSLMGNGERRMEK